jgi:hypothetical protein
MSGARFILNGVGILAILTTLLVIVFAIPKFRLDQPYLARQFGESDATTIAGG